MVGREVTNEEHRDEASEAGKLPMTRNKVTKLVRNAKIPTRNIVTKLVRNAVKQGSYQ
jgi:hypothetical protein